MVYHSGRGFVISSPSSGGNASLATNKPTPFSNVPALTGGSNSLALPLPLDGQQPVQMGEDELIVRDSKFLDADGNIDWDTWAPNEERVSGTIQEGQTLYVGTIIDRYGNPYGKYTSPIGVPY